MTRYIKPGRPSSIDPVEAAGAFALVCIGIACLALVALAIREVIG